MSFSSDLKLEIIADNVKNACCHRAFIHGVLFSKASIVDGEIAFNIENDVYAEFLSKFIGEIYGKTAVIKRSEKGGRCRIVSFFSKSAAKYIEMLSNGGEPYEARCPYCFSAFLRGVFFACGRISDPQKQYLLEFSPILRPEGFTCLLAESGIEIKSSLRRGQRILYIKKSSMIEDFFALASMNNAAFRIMNVKIESELRNNANRVANCETNNIDRAVSASHKQLAVLDELYKNNLLSSLPEELERTARLRLSNRDLSIPQLAAISIPPISKSGLTHRLNKIMEIAGQMLPSIKK